MNDKNICGAKTKKDGSPCQRAPVPGRRRCHLHGGRQPRGTASPNFKHGLYSNYVTESVSDILRELEKQDEEDLINPQNEIRLFQALILSAKALKRELKDLDELDRLSLIINRLINAKQRSQAIMLEQNRLIPASDLQLFLNWMEELLINKVGDQMAYEIMNKLQNFRIGEQQ